MKKYFFVAMFAAVAALGCRAARAAMIYHPEGTVPEQKPLMPPPSDGAPNFSNNVNFEDGTLPASGDQTPESGAASGDFGQAESGQEDPGGDTSAAAAPSSQSAPAFDWRGLLWRITGIMIVAVLAYLILKRYGKKD
jgi:hypothetical protein